MNKTNVSQKPPFSRKPRKNKTSFMKIFIRVVLVAFIVAIGVLLGFVGATMKKLPSVTGVQPSASSRIYDINGDLISTIHATENRLPISLNQTPKNLQNAFVAAEDVRFYKHNGVDPRGILRAVFSNITHKGIAQGGSTITQQLARNAFLNQERTLSRKVKEALLAIKIENNYTKPEILEMYMNQIYFGQGAYGVQAAARTYFGVDASDLSLAQCALIAGLPNSPNYLNPFNNLDASKNRQAVVLNQMAKYGFITEDEANQAKTADIHLLPAPSARKDADIFSYFTDYVVQQVAKKYGEDAIYKGGLQIYTTIDKNAQKAAVNSLKLLPTFYTDDNGVAQPQGALIAINPHNGFIIAMVGGRGTDYFNRTILAERQPGSAFKPFVYIAAIQQGLTPGTIMEDKEIHYGSYSPQNYERTFSGRMTLRYALTHSVNTIAVQLAQKVGMSNVIDIAKDMGLSTLNSSDDNLAAALGGLTNGVTPIDMASAYGVLANNGVLVSPVSITKVLNRDGQILEEYQTRERTVLSADTAYVITSMLQSVVNSGTGGRANIGVPAAGKTGTTDDSKDAWFVGYTPNLSCAVWMGDDNGSATLHGYTGGTIPAEIWRSFMSEVVAKNGAANFVPPSPKAAAIAALGYEAPKPEDEDDKDSKDGKKAKSKKESKSKKSTKKLIVIPTKTSTVSDDDEITEVQFNIED